MNFLNTRTYPLTIQYLVCVGLVLVVSGVLFISTDLIGYRVVALILLVSVSIIAMIFEIGPVMFAAILSAFVWNFFFIPPLYTFHISNTEDVLMFILYFLVALVNGVLTNRIREAERRARDKEEKEKTIKLYNALLNSLSHELRTPIATIIGAIDTIRENNENLSNEDRSELLSAINLAGLRLNRQVENLLSMSRLEGGMLKPKLDWCDVNELINGVIQTFGHGVAQRIVFNENDSLPLFKLDSGLIHQVLYNLVHNAIVYTTDDSTIFIAVAEDSGTCTITIADNGKGIPENESALVFEKFYRLPESKAGGSGLGLSIAKGFVEAHNGTIGLKRNPGGGALFIISIPTEVTFVNRLKYE